MPDIVAGGGSAHGDHSPRHGRQGGDRRLPGDGLVPERQEPGTEGVRPRPSVRRAREGDPLLQVLQARPDGQAAVLLPGVPDRERLPRPCVSPNRTTARRWSVPSG